MRRIVLTGVKAREELAKGADFLANAVGSTLGPFGGNFFLEKANKITNDGVSIAREISLNDEVQNRGVIALREAAIKTNDEAGDGTTTAIVLAQAIYKACSKLLGKEGVAGKLTPAEVIAQIERERIEVTQKLQDRATQIETKEQIIESATVSTEDKDLGTLIGNAQWELGPDGILIAEPSNSRTCEIERVKGIRIDNGLTASQVMNNIEKQSLEVADTYVILTSYTLHNLLPLEKLMNQMLKRGPVTIVVIARAWTEEGIKTCLENINQGRLKIYPLNAPYEDMNERFKDLAAITGATFYDSEAYSLEDIQVSDVGYADKIVAQRYETTITGRNDDKTVERVAARITELEDKLKGSESEFEKKTIQKRLAQLKDGFAIVKVGSSSDMERERLTDKCEDAVNAVRAAFQEGTVKGGGLALKEISDELPDSYILKRALQAPYEQIMSRAPADFIIEDWVRDPLKVIRIALERACAAASSFATAEGVICAEVPRPLDEILKARQ